jgi:hypothetical protein
MITIKLVPSADGKIVLSQGLQENDGYEFRREITTLAKKERPLEHRQQGAFTGEDYRRSSVIPFVA